MIANTFDLLKTSWRVLQIDHELLLFTRISAALLIAFLLLGLGSFSGTSGGTWGSGLSGGGNRADDITPGLISEAHS